MLLKDLPDDLIKLIYLHSCEYYKHPHLIFLNLNLLDTLILLNHNSLELLKPTYKIIIDMKIKYYKSFKFPDNVFDIFGSYFNMAKVPYIKSQPEFIDNESALSNIYNYDLRDKPGIVFSQDIYNRPFFCFKLRFKRFKGERINICTQKICTLYKTSSCCPLIDNSWHFASKYGNNLNYYTRYDYYVDCNNFREIVRGNTVKKYGQYISLIM